MADSRSQSSRSFCMMHKESIQMYWSPSLRVMMMASWKVFVNFLKGMHVVYFLIDSVVVVKKRILPQQWLSVAYLPVAPSVMKRRGSWDPFVGPTSTTLVGSLGRVVLICASPVPRIVLEQALWFSRHASSQWLSRLNASSEPGSVRGGLPDMPSNA